MVEQCVCGAELFPRLAPLCLFSFLAQTAIFRGLPPIDMTVAGRIDNRYCRVSSELVTG